MSLVPVNVVPQLSDQVWTNDVLHLMAVKLGMVVIVCVVRVCVCVVCVCEGGVCK